MSKSLHIIYKNTNCVDFIYPEFYLKNKLGCRFDYLIWDFNQDHIKKYLPKKEGFDYNTYSVWNFINNRFYVKKLEQTYYLKRIYYFIIKKIDLLLQKKKLKEFLLKYDDIFIDCRECDYIPYVREFSNILKSIHKAIKFVPHGPHYRDNIRETSLDQKIYFEGLKKKLILSNKYSKPWIDIGGFKKNECFYNGLPAKNNDWLVNIVKLKKKNYDEKNIGFLFRPFFLNFNNKILNLKKTDHYINSFEENNTFIDIAKKLYQDGYKILFRLHPSSKFDSFRKFYGKNLEGLEFELCTNTIHDFYLKCQYVLSFNSSSLIYGCLYDKNIFLKKNSLTLKVWDEWKGIDKIYDTFCNYFLDEKDFFEKFKNKKNLKKFNKETTLDMLW